MSGVSDLLDQYGITFDEGRAFIYAFLSSPKTIYDTAGKYGVTFEMLGELYGQNVSTDDVKAFFSAQGFDASSDTPVSSVSYSSSLSSLLSAKSNTIATISGLATSETEYVSSVLSGESWTGDSITYSFPTSMPTSHLTQGRDTSSGWRTLTTTEQAAFEAAVALQNSYTAVDLVEAEAGETADIQIVAVRQTSAEAFAYFPGDTDISGDIFLNANGLREDADYYSTGGYGIYTMIHELGHAMGLEHTFEGDSILDTSVDNTYYSAMSYTIPAGYETEAEDLGFRYSTYTTGAYRSELAIIDIAALQVMYGADMETNAGDTVYVYNESERKFESSTGYYTTIWDAGGEDTLDLSSASYSSIIDLNDYTLSSVSLRSTYEEAVEAAKAAGLTSDSEIAFVQDFIESLGDDAFLNENNLGIAFGVVIENVITGKGNDTVTDNEVDNQIYTGAGDDTVYLGAGGYDLVDGGTGTDTVVLTVSYNSVERYLDDEGYHIIGDDFAATLVGIEVVQYSDTSTAIA